ncbi:MAG: hypothetical protein ACKOXF_06840 [Chitinophagaceae bacterium]
MKKVILAAAILTMSVQACKDKDNGVVTPKSTLTVRQQAMIGKDWMIHSVMMDTMDVTPFLDACIKDNIMHHFTDESKGYADEGATKCDASDSQRMVLSWKLINNESRLVIHQSGERDTFDIESVNTTELKYRIDGALITLRNK